MEFKKLNGYVNESSFISFDIDNGNSSNCISDQLWIRNDGKLLELDENANDEIVKRAISLFSDSKDQQAFKDALRRMNVTVDHP